MCLHMTVLFISRVSCQDAGLEKFPNEVFKNIVKINLLSFRMFGFGFLSSVSKDEYYERINKKYEKKMKRGSSNIPTEEVLLICKSRSRGRRVSMVLVSFCFGSS